MNKHIIATIMFLLIPLSAWPADIEKVVIDKEKTLSEDWWPKKYSGDPRDCIKVDAALFLDQLYSENNPDSRYEIYDQVDLNLDGVCEILATTPCGKWCESEAFQLVGNVFLDIGGGIGLYGDYLEPYNGWLQYRYHIGSGEFLVRNETGYYGYHRVDRYEVIRSEGHQTYLYLKTEYFKPHKNDIDEWFNKLRLEKYGQPNNKNKAPTDINTDKQK